MKIPVTTILFLLPALGFLAIGCTGTRPSNLGVRAGKLAPCPASPNCVSSQDADPEHFVEPFSYTAPTREAQSELKNIILGMKRTRIVSGTGTYLYTEFTSALWRFVDDVEFSFDEQAKLIQVRSASRLGHSDLGVNRKRVEEIRKRWKASGK